MKIIIQGSDGRGITLHIPLRLFETRLGSLLAVKALNSRSADGAPPALPASEEPDAPATALSAAVQPAAPMTARQLRALGRALRTGAVSLRASGLPLLELRGSDGSQLRIEL